MLFASNRSSQIEKAHFAAPPVCIVSLQICMAMSRLLSARSSAAAASQLQQAEPPQGDMVVTPTGGYSVLLGTPRQKADMGSHPRPRSIGIHMCML